MGSMKQQRGGVTGWLARAWAARPLMVAGAGAVVAMLVAAGAYSAATLSAQQRAGEQLERATRILEQADSLVVDIDEVISSEITSELARPAQTAAAKVDDAAGRLKEAQALVKSATPHLGEDDQSRAQIITAAARARLEMLAQAPAILSANAKAASALPKSSEAWIKTLAAKEDSDRAVAQYNKLTKAGVTTSGRLNKRAQTELTAARAGFVAAEEAFPEADFEAFIAYVDLRIELNALSRESDEAWLDDDLAKANANTNKYNTKDAQGVAMAKQLPVSPAQLVADAYEQLVGAATDEYFAARARATKADDRLRTR